MWKRSRRPESHSEAELEALVSQLGRGMWRHVRAYQKLVRIKTPEAGEYFMRTFVNHPSEKVRAAMLRLIPRTDAQRRHTLIYRGLRDPAPAVRMVAVAILAEEGDASDLTALAEAFGYAHERLQIHVPGEGGGGFECPHFAEHYVAGRCGEAIAAIAERGSAPARTWAISFFHRALGQWPDASEKFRLALRRLERAAAKDVPPAAEANPQRQD